MLRALFNSTWHLAIWLYAVAPAHAQAPLTNCTTSGTLMGNVCTFSVTNTTDGGAGSLRQAIVDANAWGNYANDVQNSSVINISTSGTIVLGAALPMLFSNMAIIGPVGGINISGENLHRCVFVSGLPFSDNGTPQAISVSLANLTLRNCSAKGGDGGSGGSSFGYDGTGGGGGLGAGAALFVNEGASVIISNLSYLQNRAVGGNGGTVPTSGGGPSGGGGGMHGRGADGIAGVAHGAGGGLGGAGASAGGGIGANASGTTPGGFSSSPGIGQISALQAFPPSKVGVGGSHGNACGSGSPGGFGAGGGGSIDMCFISTSGALGGFGGGGGSGGGAGAAGGFGGGGGGAGFDNFNAGLGGFGAGHGGDEGAGDGGAGLGGAVFVRSGATLVVRGNSTTSGGAVTPGTGPGFARNGDAGGSGWFLHGPQSLRFAPALIETQSIADAISDFSNTGFPASGPSGIIKSGAGNLLLTAANDFRGGTTLEDGILRAGNATALGAGALTHTGGTLAMVTPTSLAVSGYTQSIGATLAVVLTGAGCTAQDQLSVNGPVSIAGNLTISFANGCLPVVGRSFTLLRKDSPGAISGTFSNFPGNAATINGASYTINYTGGDGNDVVVTLVSTTLAVDAVVSRKTQGAAEFDIPINVSQDITGSVSVDSRIIGSGHKIVFTLNQPAVSVGAVSAVDAASLPIGTATALTMGNDIIVTLTGVPENRRVKIVLSGINGSFDTTVSLGFLVGDVNGSRAVNSSDISGVKARSGQAVDANNFRFDVNATGVINSSDISTVKARSGLVLP